MEKWKTLASEPAFDNPWCRVRRDTVQLPSGKIIDDYFVSVRPEVVLVFPVTAGGNAIMVRQYKHGAGEILLEFPGGVFDPETETAEAGAARELREETGYTAATLEPLTAVYDNPTKDTNMIYFFLARNAEKTHETEFDATEDIETLEIPLSQIPELIKTGQIKVTGSVAIYFMAMMALETKI